MSREPVGAEEQILQLSGQRTAPSLERASAERPCKGARGEHAQHSQVTPKEEWRSERWGPEYRSCGTTKAIERTLALTGIRWESI